MYQISSIIYQVSDSIKYQVSWIQVSYIKYHISNQILILILNQSITQVIEEFSLLKMSYFNELLEEMSVKVSG